MPLLLLGARTRSIAILLGLGLHFMFGLFVAGFSLLMWATYFLLLPDTALDPALERMSKLEARLLRTIPRSSPLRRAPGWLRQVAAFAALGFAVLLIKDVPRLRGLTQQETLLLPLSVILGGVLVSSVLHSRMQLPIERPARRAMTLAVLFPLLLFANGALPYIGVRNTLSFSMFSNLRTEGGASNHLFLPSIDTPFSVLDDQVQILDSSDAVLQRYARPQHRIRWNWTALIARGQEAQFELPYFMLRYRLRELRDRGQPAFSIRFRRAGEVHTLSPEEVGALSVPSRLASWFHWSRGTPLPPQRNACTW